MPKVLMSVKLEPDLMEWVRAQADRAGVDRTSIVVEALETFRSRRSALRETLHASDGRRPEIEPVRTKPQGRESRPATPKTEIAHKDGDPLNNALANLKERAAVGSTRRIMGKDGKSGAPLMLYREKLVRYDGETPVWERVT